MIAVFVRGVGQDLFDAGADRNGAPIDDDLLYPVDQLPTDGAGGLIADFNERVLRIGQIEFLVPSDASAHRHAGTCQNDLWTRDLFDILRDVGRHDVFET